MYDASSRWWDNRILSISQPHVRPIVRGKDGKRVEFGAKMGVFLPYQMIIWDTYNEFYDLQNQP